MGNRKISEFTLLTGAGVSATNDYLPINDVSNPSASQNSRITVNELGIAMHANLTYAAGALASGAVNLQQYTATFTSHAAGTNVRALLVSATGSGANAFTAQQALRVESDHAGSVANPSVAAIVASARVLSTGDATILRGVLAQMTLSSSGNAATVTYFEAAAPGLSSTGAITTLIGFSAAADLGHATLVTNAIGHDCGNFTGALTLTAAYRSQMTSGTGKWGFYASGTANNAFAGNVRIGSVVAPTVALDVTGAVLVSSTISAGGSITSTGGDITATRASVAGTVAIIASNTDNTNTASHGSVQITSGGASGGDALLQFSISGVLSAHVGMDNSLSDILTIGYGSAVGTEPVLKFTRTAGATNYLNIVHAGSGSGDPVRIVAEGADSVIGLNFGVKGGAGIDFRTGGNADVQFLINPTASATRYIIVTGSNGGNPTLATSAGSLAITPAIVAASSITTGTPASGTSGAWKFGIAAVVSPTSPNRTIELDVGGTIYYVHAKTTNN